VLALLSAGSTLTAHSQEQAAQLAALATDAIRKILTDPSTPAHVRLKAALAILDKVTVFSAVSASQRSLREPTESMPNPDPQSDKTNPPQETLHKSAQSDPLAEPYREPAAAFYRSRPLFPKQVPAPAPAPKTGRNDPCPCGSQKKFKHCCLNGQQAA
jgi:hypothetical protein